LTQRSTGPDRVILPISALEIGRSPLDLTIDLSRIDLGDWLKARAPLHLVGSIDKFGEGITIRGQGEVVIDEICSRCTCPIERALELEILVYSDRRGSDPEADSRQLEQEGELVYHDGVNIDLTEAIREAAILAVPPNPLCREDCRGLCAGCGADLNNEPCRCSAPAPDARWAALDRIRKDL
jgi:uncharacterized protein